MTAPTAQPPSPDRDFPGDGPLIAAAGLTDRQRDVYQLTREGLKVPEVARRLEVSDNTVRDCLAQIRRKVALALRRAEARAAANSQPTDPEQR